MQNGDALTLLWHCFRFHRYRLRFAFPIRNSYPTDIPRKVPLNCQGSASVRLSVAERADIIVDFGKIKSSRVYLVNRLEQINGRGPTGRVLNPGTPIIQINIGTAVPDYSVDPAAAPLMLRALPDVDFNALL